MSMPIRCLFFWEAEGTGRQRAAASSSQNCARLLAAVEIIEQDHRFKKKIGRPMQTFKSFNSAAATLAGIVVAHMIRQGQFDRPRKSGYKQFAKYAG